MRKLFSFEQIIKALANTSMLLVCVTAITLLTTSCSTAPTKQAASTNTTVSSLDIQKELECRYLEVTGTRFKRKACKAIEIWAAIDKKNEKEADELVRTVREKSTFPGKDSAGGKLNTPMTTEGQW